MGYRSQVVLYVGPEVMPQFMVTMAKSSQARELCFADTDQMVKDYGDVKGSFLFSWGWLKWYDSYPEVQAIMDFMDWCDGEDLPTGKKDAEGKEITTYAADFYRFIRIGEDLDDIDIKGHYASCDIGVDRSISF